MSQFDVYRNPRGRSRARYLLDVQHNVLGDLKTRVVVPLLSLEQVKPMTRLNPVFDVEGGKFVMSTPEIAGVRMQDIGEKVGSLDQRRTEIIAALDYLFTGI
jgi:toxin CcdB